MIKKLYVLTLISLLVFNISFSQDLLSYTTESSATERDNAEKKSPVFEFKAYPRDSYLNSITKEMAGEHLLGELIAKKIYLFNEFYTSEENLFPGNPATKTVIKKPVIYEAVKRIERDLKKSVKKGETSVSEASSILNTVLDVALNVQTEDTRDFEKAIQNAGNTKSKIDLFTKMVRLNY
jgi:predicted amidohydrolase YtcJ